MIKRILFLALTFTLTGCIGLVSHPTFYAEPEPGNYHRSLSIATGYRDSDQDGVRDYRDACVHSSPSQVVGANGCGIRAAAPQPRPRGQMFSIEGDAFNYDSAEPSPEMGAHLALLSQRLKNQGARTRITVVGHADSQGNAAYNQALSERRARTIATYLVSQGIDAYRIEVQGAGETQPVASNATAAGRAKNRRVEIYMFAQP
uniref:OmpA family protein n=1 Tax=Marinobacterium profundum TaxID=1714300 RepID=UPI00082EDFC2|nr:OmpA family protein [Marinobacterium profundum]